MENLPAVKKLLLLLFYLQLVGCSGCKDSLSDINQLPPVTQDGANTFGAIVNGKVWVPAGFNGTPNLQYNYDPGYAYGTLNVGAYRRTDSVENDVTDLGFALDSLNNCTIPHSFALKPNSNIAFDYTRYPCVYAAEDSSTKSSGSVTISKLDTVARIVSGTFSGILIKAGCDTITITDGRFDLKL
jgi:hypothetical protein